MEKSKHIIAVAVLTVASTVGLYFLLFRWMFLLPFAASEEAALIDGLVDAHIWMISLLFSLIMVIMLYAVVIFRRDPDDKEDGPHIHGNTTLEVAWTVVPTLIVLGFGFWGVDVLNKITVDKNDAMVVEVIGRQWSWVFSYPEADVSGVAEMVLPVDRPVRLEMDSADVLHSFWVPEFRVKQDLVPGGEPEILRFTPTEIGDYKLRCAEICGLDHAGMLAPVRVVSQADFEEWLAEAGQKTNFAVLAPEERGAIWATGGEGGWASCLGCHSLDGSAGAGPTWSGIYLREEELDDGSVVAADDEYITDSIINPNAQIVFWLCC